MTAAVLLFLALCWQLPEDHPPQPARDAKGRIARSESAKNAFKRLHPCPATSVPDVGWISDLLESSTGRDRQLLHVVDYVSRCHHQVPTDYIVCRHLVYVGNNSRTVRSGGRYTKYTGKLLVHCAVYECRRSDTVQIVHVECSAVAGFCNVG